MNKKIKIPCILNKASLGDADYVFAILDCVPQKIVYPLRESVIVDKQPIVNDKLTGKIEVDFISKNKNTGEVTIEFMDGEHLNRFTIKLK